MRKEKDNWAVASLQRLRSKSQHATAVQFIGNYLANAKNYRFRFKEKKVSGWE